MSSGDELRLRSAKLFGRKTILFSRHDGWKRDIQRHLKGHVPFFYELDEVTPGVFDMVVPLTVDAEHYINAHPTSFAATRLLCPVDSCIELCDDKERFLRFLMEEGFGALVPRIGDDLAYPYVLKRRAGCWGEGIWIIRNGDDERVRAKEIASGNCFKQEYVEGRVEYTAHMVFHQGKVWFWKALGFSFAREHCIKGKDFEPVAIEEVDHHRFQPVFREILRRIDYRGICCFNYKLVDDQPRIFELNPRYGGSLTPFVNEALAAYRRAAETSGPRGPAQDGAQP